MEGLDNESEQNSLFDINEPEHNNNAKHRSDGDIVKGPLIAAAKRRDPVESEQY